MQINRTSLGHFADDILVRCPRCSARARLAELPVGTGYRLTCTSCALVREWVLGRDGSCPLPGAGPTLHGFDVDLWLQTPCCGDRLWAYNEDHIAFLEGLVSAKLRERRRDPRWGWSNGTLDSRLPKWLLSSKNRRQVLVSLSRLRELAA